MTTRAILSDDVERYLRLPRLMLRGWAIVSLISVAVIVLAQLFGGILAVLASRPAPVNITREQYSQALATWQSKDISEYEEVVFRCGPGVGRSPTNGLWKLRVRIVQGKEEVVDFNLLQKLPGCTYTVPPDPNVDDLTVGALFANVGRGFNVNMGEQLKQYGYYPYVEATMDPELGYPKSISGHIWGSECVDCEGGVITVDSLKIIK